MGHLGSPRRGFLERGRVIGWPLVSGYLPCSRHRAKHLISITLSTSPYQVGNLMITSLQLMR